MTAEERNEKALAFLENQDWENAQKLFYQNAILFPSHKTYSNLGFYLISEGLISKNGKYRSATTLGLKYLEKAKEYGHSVINYTAIAEALNLQKTSDFFKVYSILKKAAEICDNDVLKYNRLRCSYYLSEEYDEVLVSFKPLLDSFLCDECALFYLELLRKNNLKEEGNYFIQKYHQYFDESDIMLFFISTEQYEKGYKLCKKILQNHGMDELSIACILACCSKSDIFGEMASYLKEYKKNIGSFEKRMWTRIESLSANDIMNMIKSYKVPIPFVHSCCYFGCKKHQNKW